MAERYKSVLVVDLFLTRNNNTNGKKEVLLSLRKNTGMNDGEYELPGGHVEENEDLMQAMIREAKEELDINLKNENLKIIHVLHHYTEGRLNFILSANQYEGTLKINEPEKCERIEWFELDKLPTNVTSKVKKSITEITQNIFYDDIMFSKIKNKDKKQN